MNRVYKVIWSKAKHCYVVTSEIARSVTKSASSARSAGRKGAAVLALAALLFTAGGMLGEAANPVVTDVTAGGTATVNTANVITITKDDSSSTSITIDNVEHAKAAETADKADNDGEGKPIVGTYAKAADVESTYVKKAGAEVTNLTASGDVKANGTLNAVGGVFAGGDMAAAAKAALNADGSIKGADGKFTVGTDGKVTANGVDTNGGGIQTHGGDINAGSGDISGKDITALGNISGNAISGTTITGTSLSTKGGTISGGAITGTSLNTQNGEINGGDIKSSGTITTTGDINGNNINATGKITTKNLAVTGGLEMNHITLGSKPNNYTEIDSGNVTSKILATDGGVEYTAESFFDKDGSSITVRTNEGSVDSTGNSTVGGKEIIQYLGNNAVPDGKNVTRRMVRNDNGTFSMVDTAVDGKDKYSIVGQNAEERMVIVVEGTKNLNVTENLTAGIVSETNDGADKKVTLTQGMDGTYKVETSGTSTEEIGGQKIENYNGGLDTNITGDETHDVSGTMTTTVEGQAKENFKNGLDTNITGDETHDVSGTMTTTVGEQATENFNGGLDTNITGDETHDVSGTMTTTVGEQATENFNGGLDTNITGDETHDVSGTMTTTVTGDSSLSAKNISNTAENGTITNTAQTVKTITGKNTVTSDTSGTTFENTGANTPMADGNEQGSRTDTKIKGNTVETGKVMTDFADVNNNLTVGGSTTLGRDGNTTLTVKSKSTFEDTVKMDKTLEVDGESTFNNKVTITKGGLDVKGGTTTDTLTVTGDSEFVGRADFRHNVFMDEDLTVGGETRTGTLYVNNDGYVDGNLYVEGNIETHDAELSENSRQVVTGRQLYRTNERVDRLDSRIKKVGANAAALAALRPGDFNPDDKFSIAAGFGTYRNANAAALGLFYRPNENVLLSLGTSFGDGENMVNAGVSVKFGRGKSMAERRKEMAEEVSSMRDEMRSQDERIAELEEMLKKQSELIEKLSKES